MIGGVDVAAVQARTRLLDAADCAALDASDVLDHGSANEAGLERAVPIPTARSVSRRRSTSQLSPYPRHPFVGADRWHRQPGRTDGGHRLRRVVATLIAASVLEAVGGLVQITVESRARSGMC